LPSDASKDDLQRRRVGLHNVGHPVSADMTSELTSFIHESCWNSFSIWFRGNMKKLNCSYCLSYK
jgi:hypothetical protein